MFNILDDFTEHEVRVHVNRLREMLTSFKSPVVSYGIDQGISFCGAVAQQVPKKKGDKKEDDIQATIDQFKSFDEPKQDDLESLLPPNFRKKDVKCLNSIAISSWNPVPHQRKLAGDIMYLVVETLEGKSLEITCSTFGFFVNQSQASNFNPSRKGKSRARLRIFRRSLL